MTYSFLCYRQLAKAVKIRSEESRDQAWVAYANERQQPYDSHPRGDFF